MSTQVPLGTLNPWSGAGSYNTLVQLIQNQLSKVQTVTLAQVRACTNDGLLAPFGFVDVVPMVAQVDGLGRAVPHVTLYGIPYLRIQGGSSAIIIDPQPGDVGILLSASRDISSVVATQAPNTPGSPRQFNFADSLYIGGLLNAAPTQYLQFNEDGINVTAPSIVMGAQGSTPQTLMTDAFYTWFTTDILPLLTAVGYRGPAPPSNSVTTSVKGS